MPKAETPDGSCSPVAANRNSEEGNMTSQKAARIRWAILKRVKREIAGKGDNFVWVGFVRKDKKA
jgi:hypothetical protein